MSALEITFLVLFLFVLLMHFIVLVPLIQVFCKCWLSGETISFPVLIAMKIRRTPLEKLTDAYVQCRKAGLDIEIGELEAEYMAMPDDFDVYVEERIKIEREERAKDSS